MSQQQYGPLVHRRRRPRFLLVLAAVVLGVLVSACNDTADSSPTAAGGTTGTSTPLAPPTDAAVVPSGGAAAPTTAVPSTAPAPAGVDFAMPDLVGLDLQSAQDLVQTHGVFLSRSHDLLGSRNQVVDSNWVVCDQNVPAGQQVTGDAEGVIDLGVVKRGEPCP